MSHVVLAEAQPLEAMVRRAAAGDEAAFAHLVAVHHAQMARVAYVITGDPELARDAVQSAWLVAWRRLRSLREPAQVRSWLVAIAANEARQAVRKRGRHPVVDISVVDQASTVEDPAREIRSLDLARALARLKLEDRVLLATRYVAELDSNEMARQTGLSASGVRSRLTRLLDRLRTELDDDR